MTDPSTLLQKFETGPLTLGVVGAGAMGRGIAQLALQAGLEVVLGDVDGAVAEKAKAFVADMLARAAKKGRIAEDAVEPMLARLTPAPCGGEAGYGAFAKCDLVVEAVVERLDIKRSVFDGLEAACAPDAVLATNTSSLSVTALQAGAKDPARMAGLHFFNPVPLMKLVEVIPGLKTADGIAPALEAFVRRTGHHAVRASDTPGFLVNHAGRAFGTEGARIVSERIADFADVDRVMTEVIGFRMGPFELWDLTGLDVSHPAMESIYQQYYAEPRYRPTYLTEQRYTAGLFGRKSGEGFYAYEDGQIQRPAEAPAPAWPQDRPVWVDPTDGEAADTLLGLLKAAGAEIDPGNRPGANSLCLVAPIGTDATTTALERDLPPARVVAVDPLYGFIRRRTIMGTPATEPALLDAARGLLMADGTPVTQIADSPGFIAQRMLAAIVNLGADIAQQGIASPADIDMAVELGLAYPLGPLKLGDEIGPRTVLRILEALQAFYGDPRYRPSPWLKRRALLGMPLTQV